MNQQDAPMASAVGPISLQEAFRTLELGLELAETQTATLVITADGIEVDAPGDYGHREYPWCDLEIQSRLQRRHRGHEGSLAPWMDPIAPTRWSVLLRAIGQLLDARAIRQCVVQVTMSMAEAPEDFQVAVTVDGKPAVNTEEVRLQLHRLRDRREPELDKQQANQP